MGGARRKSTGTLASVTYAVKEIFYTLQGEGVNAGRPAVFCRFAGCNLWTGREADRASAVCRFCDTDFVGTDGPGGGKFERAADLAEAIAHTGPLRAVCGRSSSAPAASRCCNSTRGSSALHDRGFDVAVETNGTCRRRRASTGSA